MIVGRYADDVGVAQKIDMVGEQVAQRRLRQRIEILRVERTVAHHDRRTVGNDLDRARRIVGETHLARFLNVERPLDASAVRADLHETPDQRLHPGEIAADLFEKRALFGIESGRLCRRTLVEREREGEKSSGRRGGCGSRGRGTGRRRVHDRRRRRCGARLGAGIGGRQRYALREDGSGGKHAASHRHNNEAGASPQPCRHVPLPVRCRARPWPSQTANRGIWRIRG